MSNNWSNKLLLPINKLLEELKREINKWAKELEQGKKNKMNCEHKDAYIREERLEEENGRDYIEKLSEEDRKYQINSKGTLAQNNAFGEIISYCPDCGLKIPVICGHGGSMWLCRNCKEMILKNREAK